MNCKKGDLAVIVANDFRQNIGAIVEVLEPRTMTTGEAAWSVRSAGSREFVCYELRDGERTGNIVSAEIVRIRDCDLRPIRDTDGTDEILALIGKPVGDEVAA